MQLRASRICGAPLAVLLILAANGLDIALHTKSSLETAGHRQPLLSGEKSSEDEPWANIVEALVEMESEDANLVRVAKERPSIFSLLVGSRVSKVVGVPLARIVVILPNVPAQAADDSLACQPTSQEFVSGAFVARYASDANTSYVCQPFKHVLNNTYTSAPAPAAGSLLQRRRQKWQQLQPHVEAHWEVGIVPPTRVNGDTMESWEVADMLVDASVGSGNPEGHLLENGTWIVTTGKSGRYMAYFPDTRAALWGAPLPPPKRTSLPLGENLGWGAPAPAAAAASASKLVHRPPATAAEILEQAQDMNEQTGKSLQEMQENQAAESAAQAYMLNASGQPGLTSVSHWPNLWPYPVNSVWR